MDNIIKKEIFAKRFDSNPILSPRPNNPWETYGVFNPAVFKINNKIYIVYRQISFNGISTWGLAISDGYEILDRLEEPIYLPTSKIDTHPDFYNRISKYLEEKVDIRKIRKEYMSGYSYFGAEDPRGVVIGNYIYITYVAFNGVEVPRVALTRIKVKDFLKERWDKWEKPILITHPEITDKSAVMFNEKYNNKWCFFHRIFPDIWFDCVNSLEEFKRGRFLYGRPVIRTRPKYWDSRKIGPGSPPIRYNGFWVLIYYGVSGWDEYYRQLGLKPSDFLINDGYKYKAGLMVLDYENIYRDLYRSPYPLIEPKEWYELHWPKPNVVYPTGAVIKKDKLLFYYGASDYFVAGAEINLEDLRELTEEMREKREILLGKKPL